MINKTPINENGDNEYEKCWRVKEFSEWLGIAPQTIYNHISLGILNSSCYRKFGNVLIFLPWICKKLLESDTLLIYGVIQTRKRKYR